ncbi:TIGR04197 family type VII secretion effector [Ligilactobacillus acidipiscis]|uniref:TIGR04197 family type VII secretion effector n=1 Tax=Ligilactobacillus acidipiscis TaxID=89059 RepID=UPI0023F6B5D1|nr:TIGR04197 family type VII secretion effector [Ligilactobacillus acidipiscis]WEV57139.1 TIGR04197 family type VII secretion effector [Ligilactobacillus acidipiscis]
MGKIASNIEIAQRHAKKFTVVDPQTTKSSSEKGTTNLTAVQKMNSATKQAAQTRKELLAAAQSLGQSLGKLATTIEQRDQEIGQQWK